MCKMYGVELKEWNNKNLTFHVKIILIIYNVEKLIICILIIYKSFHTHI